MLQTLLDIVNVDDHLWIWLLCVCVLAWFISYRSFGPILYISQQKHLFDEPDNRSAHKHNTPILGGVGIYMIGRKRQVPQM